MEIEDLDPLAAWDWPSEPTAKRLEGDGLINETWGVLVDAEPAAVLQQLNLRIFRPELHHDIEAVTRRLQARGRHTPRLIPTRDGALWTTDAQGGVWRCLTWVGNRTLHQLADAEQAEKVGHLVARFHAALFDLDHTFRFSRPGAHDTVQHMAALQGVLVTHRNHRLRRRIQPIADTLWELWQIWDGPTDLPLRLCHGDLKISNIRFQDDEPLALIDLDTLQWGTLDAELGDALRSWCNPATEDDPRPRFDLGLFEGAMRGYLRGARGLPLTRAEWRSVVPGIERITIELAARFARDALQESYFGWDPAYGSAGEHNRVRAEAMTQLALAVHEAADQAEAILERLRTEEGSASW